ncbi:MAG: hypothetical protein AB7V21_13280 [Phycisphaerales bacterium]
MPPSPPSFEEWVTFCFTRSTGDASESPHPVTDGVHDRERRFFGMDPTLLTEYLTRLFEAPSFVADRYTDDDIAEATWFLFGSDSGYISDMTRGHAPADLQVRCVRAITTMYTDLFDRLCGRHGTDPDADLRDMTEIDGAVYMMWDMNNLEGMVLFPEKGPHLVDPAIEVLECVLRECRTSACRVSALHGIGHIYCYHNAQGSATIASRLRSIVDEFIARKALPEWLLDYAAHAREGYVQ